MSGTEREERGEGGREEREGERETDRQTDRGRKGVDGRTITHTPSSQETSRLRKQ